MPATPDGRPAVFLDRDGVLNRAVERDGKPYAPSRPEDLHLIDGVVEACARLRDAGYVLVVVTNQPEVARGTLDPVDLERMHDSLVATLGLDRVEVCPHDDADDCDCRKPRPGMVLRAAEELGIDLGHSVLVGDRWRDVACAHAAGIPAVFVDHGWAEQRPEEPYTAVADLAAGADVILGG